MLKALAAKAAPALFKPLVLAALTVCPPAERAPQVDVAFSARPTLYVKDVPVKTLTQALMHNTDSTFTSDSQWSVNGAMVRDIKDSGFRTQFETLHDQSGNYCLYVANVQSYIVDNPTIYLADQAAKSKCRYTVVKAHEERHVKVDFDTINEFIPKLKMAALRYVATLEPLGPYNETQMKQMQDTLQQEIRGAVEPVLQQMFQTLHMRQSRLDTPENYRREQALCPDQFAAPDDGDAGKAH
jgi:hypothetical protein